MRAKNSLEFLTSLRGIAALWVVLYHIKIYLIDFIPLSAVQFISKGYLAVDFFFVLSGFIIAMSYQNKINLLDSATITVFFKKRIARIYPLHCFMLLLYMVIPIAYYFYDKSLPSQSLYSIENFILSLFLINNWGFNSGLSWNIPSWSISTEFAAYLLFPTLTLLFKYKSRFIYVLYILVSVSILQYVFFMENTASIGGSISQLSLLRCIIEFFIGMCVWNIYKLTPGFSKIKSLLLFFISTLIYIGIFSGYLQEVFFIPLALVLLLFSLVTFNDKVRLNFLFNPVLIYLGEISYSIYLSHYFIKDIFKIIFLDQHGASLVWIISYLLTVIIFSMITYKYIEQPMRVKIGAK